MASTYTPKLNLAKPAHGDIDWHIPINGNWDELDSKLGPLYEDFTRSATDLTLNKNIDANDKNIVDVNQLTSTIGLRLPSVAPISESYRISYITSSILTGSSGPLIWYDFGDSYTIPDKYLPGTMTLQILRNVGDSYIRVIKNGVPISEGTINVAPGDVLQAQYMNYYTSYFTVAWSLYTCEIPVFPPEVTV